MEKRTGNEAPRAVAAATGRRTLCSRLENGFRSPHSVGIRVLFGGCPRSPPVTSRSIIARPRAVIICENLYMHGLIPAMWTSTSVLSLESGCKWELGDPDSGCSHRTDTKRLESASPLRSPNDHSRQQRRSFDWLVSTHDAGSIRLELQVGWILLGNRARRRLATHWVWSLVCVRPRSSADVPKVSGKLSRLIRHTRFICLKRI